MSVTAVGDNGMSRFLFSAQTAAGSDLFSSDGTAAGTVDLDLSRFDFFPDPSGYGFTGFDGETYFLGDYGNAGGNGTAFLEVFKTDGTTTGTTATLVDGLGGAAYPGGLWVLGNTLLTSGPTAERPPGIWASTDGSSFTQIESGVGASSIAASNGIGYFQAYDGNQANAGLWRTDGTAAGTYSITPSGVSLNPAGISPVAGDRTVFINQTNPDGSGPLWVTDGTASGTHALVDTALGSEVRFGGAVTNGRAIFTATDAANDISVWSTDGTAAGTVEILVNGPANAPVRVPGGYLAANGKVFFDSGYGLFVTDGSKAGTVSLSSNGEGTEGAVASGDKVFFLEPQPSVGSTNPEALFVTDGTVEGTKQISVAGLGALQGGITAVDGGIVFEGTDLAGKQALFSSDGTSAGSRELVLPAGIPISAATVIGAEPDAAGGIVTLPGGAQFYQAAAGTTVQAGDGADTILASAGQVTVDGSSGSLLFVGGTGASSVTGGSGSAIIFGGSGGGSFAGGSAGHNIFVSQSAAAANTTLTGGGGGGDEMFVAAGPTTVDGGAGGDDIVVGGTGALTIDAQKGDAAFGGSGAMVVAGSSSGADSIVGGAGALRVTGRGGNMLVVAGAGGSNIETGNGASLIFAGSGSTVVTGGAGSLQAVLGSGSASVTEGSGPSVYDVVKGAAGGTDVLNGFKPATDRIDLFGYAASDLHVTTSGGSTVVSLADGTRITLVGVTDPGGSIVG